MTIKNLLDGLQCPNKMRLQKIGALENSPELNWLQNIRENHLPKWLKSTSKEAKKLIEEVISTLDVGWYSGEAEHGAAKEKYSIQFSRLVDYFHASGLIPISWYERYEVSIDVRSISDHIDLTAKDNEGRVHRIKFDLLHASKFTPLAKLERNKPKHALELIIPAFAFGIDDVYEVWFLRGKEDSGGKYPAFEKKPGMNILSYCYKGTDLKAILDTALKLNTIAISKEDCEKCSYHGICTGYCETPLGDLQVEQSLEKQEPILTPEQEQVANWTNGSLSVIAVPGAGKTFVLIERMKRLVQKGINPSNILFLSHTRKAVEEISIRVSAALGISRDDKDLPVIMTLNGFGYSVLRDNEKLLGRSLKLASDGERKALLEKVLNDPLVAQISGVSYAIMRGQFGLVEKADVWVRYFKENGPKEFNRKYPKIDLKGVSQVSEALDKLFDEYGYIRFDEQINLVVELFKEHPELALNYSKVFRYIMVDEYQDCNAAQHEMVSKLAVHKNLVCVGDDDQAIFEFRGGSTEHILDFSSKNCTIVMADNFRTNDGVAALSNLIILKNIKRIAKSIRAQVKAKSKPVLLKNTSSDRVVDVVNNLVNAYGPGGVAIIARDNKTLKCIEEYLDKRSIPHSTSKDYLVDSKVFSLIRDILRIHADGPVVASESFTRLYVSENGFPECEADFDESFHDMLIRNGLILDCHDSVKNAKAWDKSTLPTAAFGQKIMRSYNKINYFESVPQMINDLFNIWFEGTNNELSVLSVIQDMCEEGRITTAEKALRFMNILVKYNDKTRVDYDYGSQFCRLLTAHDAKGKEFSSVVVLNVEDFIKEGTPEDVRVLYVAVTRAKHTLVLTTAGEGPIAADLIAQIAPAVRICT